MRSSVRTPSHSQENWSSHRFYETMRYIFRPIRENPDSLVEIPFHENRPLLKKEFDECTQHYIKARCEEYLCRLLASQKGRPPQFPDSERWPDVRAYGIKDQDFWKYEKPLGQLFFSKTKDEQEQAKRTVRALSTRGPRRLRTALSQAAKNTPQVHRDLSPQKIFLEVVPYLAEREFIWTFLRRESGLGRADKKAPLEVRSVANTLATAYPYLRLKSPTIAIGLVCSNQADKDTAEEFGLSPKTVRSLLSKLSHCRS